MKMASKYTSSAHSEIVKKQQKHHYVLWNCYSVCKFASISCNFIGLQEDNILAHMRMTDRQIVTRFRG